jgi:hypothetical protein
VSATLTLSRTAFGMELRRGTFDVLVDGRSAGSIEWNQTIELPIEPGRHTLQVRKGRYTSRDFSFDAADGEAVTFRCHGAGMWPRWLVSFAVPSLGLSLSRESR